MKPLSSIILAAAVAASVTLPAVAAETSYRVVSTIKTGSQSSIHCFRVDATSRRLFVARQGAVEVIDTDTDKKVGQIEVAGTVGGIALAPDLNLGFASSAGDNTISAFDLKTLKTVRTVKGIGAEPGALEYEPKTKRLFVSSPKGGIVTVIAADTGSVVGSVKVGGRPRGLAADSRGHLFVADEEQNAVHVVDAKTLSLKGGMPTWPASQPTGVLLDNKERRVYVSTASGRMVVLDPDIGQMVGYVTIGKGDSSIAAQFAPNRFVRLFVPTTDGQLTVVQNAKLTASVESALPSIGARSTAVAVDEKSGKAYLAGADEILVLNK